MQKTTKVILTGYRATGKSCVGKKLAERFGYIFLDMDKEIESQEGKTIKQMVDEKGWDYFRAREKELLTRMHAQNNMVVATGGGAIMHQDIWEKLKESAFIVWLKADQKTIADRLVSDQATTGQRPSLTGKNIVEEIRPVLKERTPLYDKGSHISIDTTSHTPDDIVTLIIKALEEKKAKNNNISGR